MLLVDDSPDVHLLLREIVTDEGGELVSAFSGEEAIRLVEKKIFTLIFMDIRMPRLDGTETLGRMRALGILIPAIAFTSLESGNGEAHYAGLGFSSYLNKDKQFNAGTVVTKILAVVFKGESKS